MKPVTKKGYITVRDSHRRDESEIKEFTESRNVCEFLIYPDRYEIKYIESASAMGDCFTTLTVGDGRVTMLRGGLYRTSMIFEKEKRHVCVYETEFGSMALGIFTKHLTAGIGDDGGEIHLVYSIDNNGRFFSESELIITVETED
ncbi:MAG: DUF1934 domain-containing protein [Clostridia bacterium]|nr:DUF1934 domain-containing protein [Clostridia bacterium]